MGISAPLAISLNVPRLPARDSFWGYVSLTACNWLSGLFIRWSCWQSKPHPPAAKRCLAMGREPRCPRLAEPHVAALSVSAGQGRGPFTVPIWYQYAPGGEAWVLTEAESRKARLIERAGRFSLMVDRIMPTTRYVSVEGSVTRTVPGTDELLREIAARYLPPDMVPAYIEFANTELGEQVAIYLRPERWLTADLGPGALPPAATRE
jgi:Pyridoxamine 5'-phosphate oxidase